MTKQQEIIKFLSTVESANLEQIYDNVSFSYYHNYQKYIGEMMSRLVKSGIVERVKKGTFKIKSNQKPNQNLLEL